MANVGCGHSARRVDLTDPQTSSRPWIGCSLVRTTQEGIIVPSDWFAGHLTDEVAEKIRKRAMPFCFMAVVLRRSRKSTTPIFTPGYNVFVTGLEGPDRQTDTGDGADRADFAEGEAGNL